MSKLIQSLLLVQDANDELQEIAREYYTRRERLLRSMLGIQADLRDEAAKLDTAAADSALQAIEFNGNPEPVVSLIGWDGVLEEVLARPTALKGGGGITLSQFGEVLPKSSAGDRNTFTISFSKLTEEELEAALGALIRVSNDPGETAELFETLLANKEEAES